MDLHLFASTFLLIFVAELPDKTAFATVLLASRGKQACAVFIGVALAFLIQCVVALAFGSVFALLLPEIVHGVAALIFLGFTVHLWLTRDAKEDDEDTCPTGASGFWKMMWKSFLVIFIAEWGDLTQIATASLVAKYPVERITIFLAALLALWAVTGLAVLLGQRLQSTLKPKWLKVGCSIICLCIGVYMLVDLGKELVR